MPSTFIPFTGWTPGGSYFEVGGSYFGEGWSTALNVYPFFDLWRPFRKFATSANVAATTTPVNGGHVHLWMTGLAGTYSADSATLFAGTSTNLYSVTTPAGVFSDVSRAANYGAAGAAGWRFWSIGNDIWAANWFDVPQRRTNNAGLFANGVTSTFVPVPRFGVAIREHSVVANLNQAGRFQDEVAWSDADNAVNFDPPTGTSTSIAGAKRLVSIPGQITGLLGGQYGLVFKRRGIYYLEYTGTTQVFRPDVLSSHVGSGYPSSIISTRYGAFFLGPDGFYQIAGLAEPQKISTPAIDRDLLNSTFSDQIPGAENPISEDGQVYGFSLPGIPLIGWAVRPAWNVSDYTVAYLYNPVTQAWSSTSINSTAGGGIYGPLLTLPYADTLFQALVGFTWDATNSSLTTWSASASDVLAPSLGLRFRPAGLESIGPYNQSAVKGVTPIFSKTSVSGAALTPTVTVEALLDPYGSPSATETAGPSLRNPANGAYPFAIAGRYFRISIACTAEDFDHFEGVWVEQEPLT